MNIKKIGHCCLVIDTENTRILTDPGTFTVAEHTAVAGVDVILITHEHADHLHTDSLKDIVAHNPEAQVVTNSSVGAVIGEVGVEYTVLEGSDTSDVAGVALEALDEKHAEIYDEVGQVQNTGYFIDNKLFYPGDAYAEPNKDVDVLALPVAGPWCRIADAIRYALRVKPNTAFPVHDGLLAEDRIGPHHRVPDNVLSENGIEFVAMVAGDERSF